MNPAQCLTESDEFNASLKLLKASPEGLVHCATEWLNHSKTAYGFDVKNAGFIAANQALAAAPSIFWHGVMELGICQQGPLFGSLFFKLEHKAAQRLT